MRNLIFATAGHIDHGKTSLIKILTGIDTDRWEEEKKRGITLDIGFAYLGGEGLKIHFIDVPGHEKLVRNMLAGAGTVQAVLLVIAADECIKPQTIEHYEICRLLGINKGLIAVTKIDLVEKDRLDLAIKEIKSFLNDGFLSKSEIVAVSSRTGEGIEALKQVIFKIARESEPPLSSGIFRLPVDRSFAVKGYGTVVTGSLIQGSIKLGEEVEALPSGKRFNVRNIQVFGEEREMASTGERTALNLQRARKEDIIRGDILTRPGLFKPFKIIDVEYELIEDSRKAIGKDKKIKFYYLSGEHKAKLKTISSENNDSRKGIARIFFEKPIFIFPGDRFILRRLSPVRTVGGGLVINNHVEGKRSINEIKAQLANLKKDKSEFLLEYIREKGTTGVKLRDLITMTGFDNGEISDILLSLEKAERIYIFSRDNLYVDVSSIENFKEIVLNIIEEYHSSNPDRPGITKNELMALFNNRIPESILIKTATLLQEEGRIAIKQGVLTNSSFIAKYDEEEKQIIQLLENEMLEKHLFSSAEELANILNKSKKSIQRTIRILLDSGTLIMLPQNLIIHRDKLKKIIEKIQNRKTVKDVISIAEFKGLTGLTRKYAIPLLEYLDRSGITKKLEDGSRKIL